MFTFAKPLAAAMLVVVTISSLHDHGVRAQDATASLFQHGGCRGQSFNYASNVDECIAIPCFDKKISSLKLDYAAPAFFSDPVQLRLYASPNCTGGTILSPVLTLGHPVGVASLAKDANDMVSSFRFAGLRRSLNSLPSNVCPYIRPRGSVV